MPHYPTDLDDGYFAVYSTVMDGLISPEMTAEEMREWLEANSYDTWLTPYDVEAVIREWADSTDMEAYYRGNERYYYYHDEAKFCYVKLSDAYFVLPESDWRNGQ